MKMKKYVPGILKDVPNKYLHCVLYDTFNLIVP